MVWLYCLISFLIGFMAFWMLARTYIWSVLKVEKKTYLKELKHSVKFWYLKPLPVIEIMKKHKDLYKKQEDKLDSELHEALHKLKKSNQALKDVNARIVDMEKENRELQDALKNAGSIQKSTSNGNNDTDIIPKKQIPVSKTVITSLFFSIPETDGSFYMEKGETAKDDRKFYWIVSAGESETGELHFISGQYDQKAIENIDYYLMPVCEVENISERNSASRVIQKEAGSVVKISGKWMTNKKVKVKLM